MNFIGLCYSTSGNLTFFVVNHSITLKELQNILVSDYDCEPTLCLSGTQKVVTPKVEVFSKTINCGNIYCIEFFKYHIDRNKFYIGQGKKDE